MPWKRTENSSKNSKIFIYTSNNLSVDLRMFSELHLWGYFCKKWLYNKYFHMYVNTYTQKHHIGHKPLSLQCVCQWLSGVYGSRVSGLRSVGIVEWVFGVVWDGREDTQTLLHTHDRRTDLRRHHLEWKLLTAALSRSANRIEQA